LAFGCSFKGLTGFGATLTGAGFAAGLAAGWAFCGFDTFFVAIQPPKLIFRI
jgi:hypothetical protein